MKRLLILYIAALVLSGCSKDDNLPPKEQTPIRFNASLTETRATNLTTANLQSFGVLAFYTVDGRKWDNNDFHSPIPNYFRGAIVEKTGGNEWVYSPFYYYPQNTPLTFIAIAPVNSSASSSIYVRQDPQNGLPIIHYSVTNIPDHADVCVDMVRDFSTKSDYVNFNFKHITTRIAIGAEVPLSVTTSIQVRLTAIEFSNVVMEADLMLGRTDIDATTGATWVRPSQSDTRFRTFTASIANGMLRSEWLSAGDAKTLTLPAGYMFMIPQHLNDIFAGATTFKLIWDISEDGGATVKETVESDPVELHQSSPNWAKGMALKYIVSYSEGTKNMQLKTEVSDWNDQPVPVPLPATYLNVSQLSVTTTVGSDVTIRYWSDGASVKGSYNGSTPAAITGGTFTFTAEVGTTYATITAGSLSRTITITAN